VSTNKNSHMKHWTQRFKEMAEAGDRQAQLKLRQWNENKASARKNHKAAEMRMFSGC
jgi:hypothetical protein